MENGKSINGGSWKWIRVGVAKGFAIERSAKFSKLVDTIYERTNVDREKVTIEITHKPPSHIFGDFVAPVFISNDADIKDLMLLYRDKEGMILYVMHIETNGNEIVWSMVIKIRAMVMVIRMKHMMIMLIVKLLEMALRLKMII